MARAARTVHIEAPSADVWAAMTDVEAWPMWAPQMKRLDRLEAGPLALGSRVRVRPKSLPAAIWRVMEYEEGRSFTWASTLVPGARVTGGHVLTPDGDTTRAEFWLEASGALGRLVGPLLRRTVFSRNTRSATQGLKRHMEARAAQL